MPFTPLWQWSFNLALHVEVLLSAGATEQVIRIPASTLSSEPAVHVGAVAAVALTVGAAAAARVTLLHVLVKTGNARPAELAHHHLIAVFGLAHVLTEKDKTKQNNWGQTGKYVFICFKVFWLTLG